MLVFDPLNPLILSSVSHFNHTPNRGSFVRISDVILDPAVLQLPSTISQR